MTSRALWLGFFTSVWFATGSSNRGVMMPQARLDSVAKGRVCVVMNQPVFRESTGR